MKCPDCGKELNENYICKNCGKKIESLQPEIEVEYKEFKVSELLEIRRKQKKLHPEGYSKSTIKKFNRSKNAIDRVKPSVKQDKARAAIKKRSIFFVLATILTGLAIIAGAFFLIRFLF
jgi:hypothetical protein